MHIEKNTQQQDLSVDHHIEQLVSARGIEISIGKQYCLDELTEVWAVHKIIEGTVINVLQTAQDISLLCSGKPPLLGFNEHKYLQTYVSNPAQINNYHSCSFHLLFTIHHHLSKDHNEQLTFSATDKSLQRIFYISDQPYDLSTKRFTLQSICIQHSPTCIGSNLEFIFQRNTNFLRSHQQLLQKLIQHKYQIDQQPLLPKDYLTFLNNFFGFHFLYHGLHQNIYHLQNNFNQVKNCKNKLKKTFDNIVKDARSIYQIPSSKKKFKKNRKPKYRLNPQSYVKNTQSNQLSSKNPNSSPNQQQQDSDSSFQPQTQKIKN